MKVSKIRRRMYSFAVSVFAVTTLFISGPINVYLNNYDEFDYTFTSLLAGLLPSPKSGDYLRTSALISLTLRLFEKPRRTLRV